MKRSLFALALCAVLALGACDGAKSPSGDVIRVLDHNTRVTDLRPYIEEVELIPLSADSVLVEGATKLIPWKGGYILESEGEMLGFDCDGRFVRRYGRAGRGPGEYYHLQDYCLDGRGEELWVLYGHNELASYSLSDGTWLRKVTAQIAHNYAEAIVPVGDGRFGFFFANPPQDDLVNLDKEFYHLKVYDADSHLVEELLPRKDFVVNMGAIVPFVTPLGDGACVLAPAISSGPSYRFDADGMAEFRTIDLGKKGLPFRYCFKDGKSPWDNFNDMMAAPYYKLQMRLCPAGEDLLHCILVGKDQQFEAFLSDGRRSISWILAPVTQMGQPFWVRASDGTSLYYMYDYTGITESDDPLVHYLLENHPFVLGPEDNPVIVRVRFRIK
ncbi:MAG: 6-bladed beta-propeller [Bacteroidales bacterium]|nr:6-bladed beta-propeller [Bacteroidales bacterium]